jgi:hypothetical protein
MGQPSNGIVDLEMLFAAEAGYQHKAPDGAGPSE